MTSLSYNKDDFELRITKDFYINGMKRQAYAIHDYYGTNKFPDVDENIRFIRKQIWDFKDGRNSEFVALKLAQAIKIKNLPLNNACFINIPASTQLKTMVRFKSFSETLCKTLGIQNGYSAITTKDHDATKGQAGGNKIEHFIFNDSFFRGKKVYLFDDVCTSGTSFRQTAGALLDNGALEVTGLFLGQTVSTFIPFGFEAIEEQNDDLELFFDEDDLPF